MPAVPMVPAADAARAVMGPDHPAAVTWVIVIRRVVVVRAVEEAAMMMPICKAESTVAIRAIMDAAATEHRAGAIGVTRMKGRAGTERRGRVVAAATAEVSRAAATPAMVTTTAAAAAMTADFDHQGVGGVLRRRRSRGIDQRHGLYAFARRRRQH